MKIFERSYANIVTNLAAETLKQLVDVDVTAPEIEPIMGIAQVHVGQGVYLTMQLKIDILTPQMMIKANQTVIEPPADE
jgi:hypothetical protein